ncbi:MAG: 4Fe-4S binding protein [Chlorobiales bacterium]
MNASSPPTASAKRNRIVRQRLILQVTTVIVHIFIIKFTIPNIWWAIFGLAFWVSVIFWVAKSGRQVCANFCWLGGVQDWLQPLAKKRVSFNPKWSQYLVLLILVSWTPILWIVTGSMFEKGELPIHLPLQGDENLFVQFGHFILLTIVGFSVMIFGRRGACHYLCPFGIAVGAAKKYAANRKPNLQHDDE